MKKKLVIVITSIFIVLGLTGCTYTIDPEKTFSTPNSKIVDFEIIDNNYYNYILRDKNTNVLYFGSSGVSGITPIYNADGSLKLYEEDWFQILYE